MVSAFCNVDMGCPPFKLSLMYCTLRGTAEEPCRVSKAAG